MDIEREVISFLSANGAVSKEAVRIDGIDKETVDNVLKLLAMQGRLNQVNGMVSLSGK